MHQHSYRWDTHGRNLKQGRKPSVHHSHLCVKIGSDHEFYSWYTSTSRRFSRADSRCLAYCSRAHRFSHKVLSLHRVDNCPRHLVRESWNGRKHNNWTQNYLPSSYGTKHQHRKTESWPAPHCYRLVRVCEPITGQQSICSNFIRYESSRLYRILPLWNYFRVYPA